MIVGFAVSEEAWGRTFSIARFVAQFKPQEIDLFDLHCLFSVMIVLNNPLIFFFFRNVACACQSNSRGNTGVLREALIATVRYAANTCLHQL